MYQLKLAECLDDSNILQENQDYAEKVIEKLNKWKPIFYETDGHYSTVYLVALQLGMNEKQALELAKATEAPDTDIDEANTYDMDQTWAYIGDQQNIHSLNGGFHGVEEFLTAFKFLYTDKNDVYTLGKLLHRYGDTYAHTSLKNMLPISVSDMHLNEVSQETLNTVIDSWRNISAMPIGDRIEPWITFLNYYINKYGEAFLADKNIQRAVLEGRTLGEYLGYIYKQPTDKFVLYGNNTYTIDHGGSDGLLPDQVYIRPEWYKSYVKNLASLLATKYNLPLSNFNEKIFDQMVDYCVKNKCSMKGIIDYEIKRQLNLKILLIPIFQRPFFRFFLNLDGNDYVKIAEDASIRAQQYAYEYYKAVSTKTERTTTAILIDLD
ncbi:hypothetical protein ACFSMX_04870 [Flectobacillus roseus]